MIGSVAIWDDEREREGEVEREREREGGSYDNLDVCIVLQLLLYTILYGHSYPKL